MSKTESSPDAESGRVARFLAQLKHAFALDGPHGAITPKDRALLRRLAQAVHKRGMTTPAIFFLETVHPVGFLGSQAMVFLQPFLTVIFSKAEYEQFTRIIERREGIHTLIAEIEALRAEASRTAPSGSDADGTRRHDETQTDAGEQG